MAKEPLNSQERGEFSPSHLSLPPQDGDLKPWCFIGGRQKVQRANTRSLPGWASRQPQSRAHWGHWSHVRGVQEPSPAAQFQCWVPQQPGTPCILAHGTGACEPWAPFPGHPLVAVAPCAPGHSLPQGPDRLARASCTVALPELVFLPQDLQAAQQQWWLQHGRSNLQPTALLGWFCSSCCCSPSADERGGGKLCIVTAAADRNGSR